MDRTSKHSKYCLVKKFEYARCTYCYIGETCFRPHARTDEYFRVPNNHCIAITCVFKLGGVYMSISRPVK